MTEEDEAILRGSRASNAPAVIPQPSTEYHDQTVTKKAKLPADDPAKKWLDPLPEKDPWDTGMPPEEIAQLGQDTPRDDRPHTENTVTQSVPTSTSDSGARRAWWPSLRRPPPCGSLISEDGIGGHGVQRSGAQGSSHLVPSSSVDG